MPLLDKNQIKKYCIVFGTLLVLFALITVLSIVGRNAKNTALHNSVVSVLSHYEDERFKLIKEVPFMQPIKSSIRIYEIQDKKHQTEAVYAGLVRITGFSGPHSCILVVYPETGLITFLGIAGYPLPQYTNTVDYGITDSMITYWGNNVMEILRTGGVL